MRISDWSSDVCSADMGATEALAHRLRPPLAGLVPDLDARRAEALRRGDHADGVGRGDLDQLVPRATDPAVGAEHDEVVGQARKGPALVGPEALLAVRSEEGRVGTEGVGTCRFRWTP